MTIKRSIAMKSNFIKTTVVAFAASLLSISSIWAGELATPEEAKALSQKAAAAAKENQEVAFAAFEEAGGPYQQKDLYVFCMDMEGKMIFHPKKPALVGKNLLDFNKYGDTLFQDMIKVAKNDGSGWVNYKWPHPNTEKVQEKASWIEAVNDTYFCGVGAYK